MSGSENLHFSFPPPHQKWWWESVQWGLRQVSQLRTSPAHKWCALLWLTLCAKNMPVSCIFQRVFIIHLACNVHTAQSVKCVQKINLVKAYLPDSKNKVHGTCMASNQMLAHWGKKRFWNCEFCEIWDFENVNCVKNETLKLWILSKIRFWNCGFCKKWQFQNVNFWINWGFLPQCVL